MTFTYEPPRSNLPAGITTGTVYGTFLRAVDDGSDAGVAPDSIPAVGRIRFVPRTPYIDYNNNLIILEERVADLDPNGEFSIELVSTNNTAPIVNWTYHVIFEISGLPIPSFDIDVPAGSDRALATIVPRSAYGSSVVVKGDKGDPGPMSIVGLNVFVDGDGDLAIDDSRRWYWGSGSPNGVLTAGVGCYYDDLNAGATNFLYRKSTATGNTGWVVVK